jgi:hypothetical protein
MMTTQSLRNPVFVALMVEAQRRGPPSPADMINTKRSQYCLVYHYTTLPEAALHLVHVLLIERANLFCKPNPAQRNVKKAIFAPPCKFDCWVDRLGLKAYQGQQRAK